MKPGEGLSDVTRSQRAAGAMGIARVGQRGRSIGEILIEAGRLESDGAAKIGLMQRELGLHFGEAAMKLGLLKLADIEFALARQFEYPYLTADDTSIAPELVSAFRPFGAVAEQLRSLRTRLLMSLLTEAKTPRSIAVVSGSAGEGRSFVAANLAIVFSQMGERTLLIDADLRKPRQHLLFRLDNRQGLSNVLLGRAHFECNASVPQFQDLSILTAGSTAPNPQELLSWPAFPAVLRDAVGSFDVVIVDTPPAGASADAQIIASRTGSAVLVARAEQSDARTLRRVRAALRESGAHLIGSVLNGA